MESYRNRRSGSKRRRLTPDERSKMQLEALHRARSSMSLTNVPTVIAGFVARGIPAADILPRENVLTYHAWRALGRQVREGEHGVKITTWITRESDETDDSGKPLEVSRFPTTAVVFHISQTDPVAASAVGGAA